MDTEKDDNSSDDKSICLRLGVVRSTVRKRYAIGSYCGNQEYPGRLLPKVIEWLLVLSRSYQ